MNSQKASKALSTKYFCDVIKDKAKVCMQLESTAGVPVVRQPHCWFLVVDVSGSMSEEGKDGMPMIDRVKVFATLAKEIVIEDDFMSVITFANDARTNVKLTKMDSEGKEKVKACLDGIRVGGQTNVEAGLMRALWEIRQTGMVGGNVTQSIILFTDGGANLGSTDGVALVKKYREDERQLGENAHVPISVLNVGNYCPALLQKVASELGSEAFYWLNEKEEFEADMLLPIALRYRTTVNNVRIVMETMNEVKFTDEKTDQHLVNHSPRRLEYFFHMLPIGIEKIFQVGLQLPPASQEQRAGLQILDITTTYRTSNGDEEELKKVLHLTGKKNLESYISDQTGER